MEPGSICYQGCQPEACVCGEEELDYEEEGQDMAPGADGAPASPPPPDGIPSIEELSKRLEAMAAEKRQLEGKREERKKLQEEAARRQAAAANLRQRKELWERISQMEAELKVLRAEEERAAAAAVLLNADDVGKFRASPGGLANACLEEAREVRDLLQSNVEKLNDKQPFSFIPPAGGNLDGTAPRHSGAGASALRAALKAEERRRQGQFGNNVPGGPRNNTQLGPQPGPSGPPAYQDDLSGGRQNGGDWGAGAGNISGKNDDLSAVKTYKSGVTSRVSDRVLFPAIFPHTELSGDFSLTEMSFEKLNFHQFVNGEMGVIMRLEGDRAQR